MAEATQTEKEASVRVALEQLRINERKINMIKPYFVQLYDQGYQTADDFQDAQRESLGNVGLKLALIDYILSAQKKTGQAGPSGLGATYGGPTHDGTIRNTEVFYSRLCHELPSASDVSQPKKYQRVMSKCVDIGGQLLNHRPSISHGPPTCILFRPFAEFVSMAASCTPCPEACILVAALMATVPKVCEDEVLDLQPELLCLLQQFLQPIGVRMWQATRAKGEADLTGEIGGHKVLLVEVGTDGKANARGQLEVYYMKHVSNLRGEGESYPSWRIGAPTIGIVISGGCVCVMALAVVHDTKFLSEPLSPTLHLFCSNDQEHALSLARLFHALRHVLSLLAEDMVAAVNQSMARSAASPPATGLQAPNVWWPFLLRSNYASCIVSQPYGFKRPVYQVQPSSSSSSSGLIIKFVQLPKGTTPEDAFNVQKMWHEAGVAPRVDNVVHICKTWWAIIMEQLQWEDGWRRLDIWAPSRPQCVPDVAVSLRMACEALSCEEWKELSEVAAAALERGHCVQVLGKGKTVHGDMRLPNILARRIHSGGPKFEVKFIDFGWAGIAGKARYPVMMSTQIRWPADANPGGVMQQNHDKEMLHAELCRGGDVAAGSMLPCWSSSGLPL